MKVRKQLGGFNPSTPGNSNTEYNNAKVTIIEYT